MHVTQVGASVHVCLSILVVTLSVHVLIFVPLVVLIVLTQFVHVDHLKSTMLTIGNVSKKSKMALTHVLTIAPLMKLVMMNVTPSYLESQRNVRATVDVPLAVRAKVDILVRNLSPQCVSKKVVMVTSILVI